MATTVKQQSKKTAKQNRQSQNYPNPHQNVWKNSNPLILEIVIKNTFYKKLLLAFIEQRLTVQYYLWIAEL